MTKKETILNSAIKMFYRDGYKKTKIEDIAADAGVSKVTIFKYFESKKKLAHEVVIKAIKDGYRDFGLIVNDSSIDFKEKVHQMVTNKSSLANAINPDFRDFMVTDMQENHGDNETLLEYDRGKDQFWNDFFAEGRKSGQLRPEISNKTVLMYIDMLLNYIVDHGESGTDTLELIDLFFNGVMKND